MDKLKEIYGDEEYTRGIESERSALEIVPLLHKISGAKSVVDVGGGIGTWLVPFTLISKEIDVCCIDGGYVRENYKLGSDTLIVKNLEEDIDIGRKFDLAISLEVAEHLSEKRAEGFVDDLINLSDIILFSAAIPFQPGDHHINCKEPGFWKNLFETRGFRRIDCIRPVIVNNPYVMWWYKNNMFLYVRDVIFNDVYTKILANGMEVWPESVGDFVHYECFYNIVEMQKYLSEKSGK